jgi:hypothetical protein
MASGFDHPLAVGRPPHFFKKLDYQPWKGSRKLKVSAQQAFQEILGASEFAFETHGITAR